MKIPSCKFYTSFCSSYLVLENLSYVIITLDSSHVAPPYDRSTLLTSIIYGWNIKFSAFNI